MKVIHEPTGAVLGSRVREMRTFWQRLRGYMFYPVVPTEFDGLFFPSTNQVHNSFVRFPLDVVFLNDEYAVVAVLRGFKPWRWSRMYMGASHVVEFPAGALFDEIRLGDRFILEE